MFACPNHCPRERSSGLQEIREDWQDYAQRPDNPVPATKKHDPFTPEAGTCTGAPALRDPGNPAFDTGDSSLFGGQGGGQGRVQGAVEISPAQPGCGGIGVLLVRRTALQGKIFPPERRVDLGQNRKTLRNVQAVKGPETDPVPEPLPQEQEPGKPGMGGLGHGAGYVEVKDRLGPGPFGPARCHKPGREFVASYPSPCCASHWLPLSVKRYFCKRLLGLSGMIISIRPSARAGLR